MNFRNYLLQQKINWPRVVLLVAALSLKLLWVCQQAPITLAFCGIKKANVNLLK